MRVAYSLQRSQHIAMLGHNFVIATLHCGMEVALDATAIRFGWQESLAPWSTYKKHRVGTVTDQMPLGPDSVGIQATRSFGALASSFLMSSMANMGSVDSMGSVGSTADSFISDVIAGNCSYVAMTEEQTLMETVVLGLHRQLNEHFEGVTEFLRLKDSEFRTAQTGVVEAAKRGLTMLAGEIENGAKLHRITVPVRSSSGTNKQQATTEKDMIWARPRDMLRAGKNVDKLRLRQLWKLRWDKEIGLVLPQSQASEAKREGGTKKA